MHYVTRAGRKTGIACESCQALEIDDVCYDEIVRTAAACYRPKSVEARLKKRFFLCSSCKRYSYDLWWFLAEMELFGGVCQSCARKIEERLFGSAGRAEFLRVTATQKMQSVLVQLLEAPKEASTVESSVLQLF